MSGIHGIQVGDEVSWNWSGGHPTGVVKEMKTSGKLEIESKGKLVHKNADEDNPAVHVEREGNDVVKRASELERQQGGDVRDNASEAAIPEGGEHEEQEKKTRSGKKGGRKTTATTRKKQSAAGKKGGAATAAKKAGGRKRGKEESEDAAVGEKRKHEGAVEEKDKKEGEDVNKEKGEMEKAEKEAGREVKKAKISPEKPDLSGEVEETHVEMEPGPRQSTAMTEAEEQMETLASTGEPSSPAGEKKRGGRKGVTRGKASA